MSVIGYYRYKLTPAANQDITFYVNGVLTSTKSVIITEQCGDTKLIKYLNKNGQFRFFGFNKYWESSDKPKEIGRANKIVTSLLNSQASESSVGYKNDRTITAYADDISQSELDVMQDLWISPKVYLHVGTNDDVSDWIEVTVSTKNPVTRLKKGNYTNLQFEIQLPEWFTINLL